MQLRTLYARFLDAKRAGGASERTIRLYDTLFAGFLTFVRDHGHREVLSNLNSRIVQDYLIHSSRYFQPNTVHNRASALSSFGRWLVRHEILQANPCDRVQRPKQVHSLPAVLSETEMAALDALPCSLAAGGLRALLAHAGLRCAEVCNLDSRDVNLTAGEYGMLYVRRAKGGAIRVIPLADVGLRDPIVSYLLSRGPIPPEDPIFPGVDTRRLRDEQLRVIVRQWGAQIGRRDLRPHLLRHSFSTLWIERGGSVTILQEILGHKQLTTTQRYVHLSQTHIASEMARLSQPKKLHGNFTRTPLDSEVKAEKPVIPQAS